MDRKDVLRVLKYILETALASEEAFAQGNHFLSHEGKPLRPAASSLPKVGRRCVGGAAIQGISVLGYNKDADTNSLEYNAVMEALAETLKVHGHQYRKNHKVQDVNNKQGFQEIRLLVEQTIERLET